MFDNPSQALCANSIVFKKSHLTAVFLDTFGVHRAKHLLGLGSGFLLLAAVTIYFQSQLWIVYTAMLFATIFLAGPMSVTVYLLWHFRKPVRRELLFFKNGFSESNQDGSAEWIPYANVQMIISGSNQITLCTKHRRISVDPNRFMQGSWEETEALILACNPRIERKGGCSSPWYILIFVAWLILICVFFIVYPWESDLNDPRIRTEDGWYEMTPGWGCEKDEPQRFILEIYDYNVKNSNRKSSCSSVYRDDDFFFCLASDLEHIEPAEAFVAVREGKQWRCIEMEKLPTQTIPIGASTITIYDSGPHLLAVFRCSQGDSISIPSEHHIYNLFDGIETLTDGILVLPASKESIQVTVNGTTLEIRQHMGQFSVFPVKR